MARQRVGGMVVGAPTAVHLPALAHHALTRAVGALVSVTSFCHRVGAARPATLAGNSRGEPRAVVVSVVGLREGAVKVRVAPTVVVA